MVTVDVNDEESIESSRAVVLFIVLKLRRKKEIEDNYTGRQG